MVGRHNYLERCAFGWDLRRWQIRPIRGVEFGGTQSYDDAALPHFRIASSIESNVVDAQAIGCRRVTSGQISY